MADGSPSTVRQEGMSDNAAGGLAYVTFIPAILFLMREPYNRRPAVRFHALQCIYLVMAWVVINFGVLLLALVPSLKWAVLFFDPLLDLVFLIIWLRVMINAFNGKRTKVPIIGDIAERRSAA